MDGSIAERNLASVCAIAAISLMLFIFMPSGKRMRQLLRENLGKKSRGKELTLV